LVAVGLSACLPPAPVTSTTITTDPVMYPPFDAGTFNYILRCAPPAPVTLRISLAQGSTVSVNGGAVSAGAFDQDVSLQPGQRLTFALTTTSGATNDYSVRCLPADWPDWGVGTAPNGRTQYFMAQPIFFGLASRTAIYDRNAVPLWWGDPQFTIFSTLLPDGNVGSMINGGVEERALDGTLVRTVQTVGAPADQHDVNLLPNGHFVMVTDQPRPGVDLSALGGPASATVCDQVVQEIDPSTGSLVWSWDVADHIPATEMDPQWYSQYIAGGPTTPDGCGYDVYHWNAIEATGSGFILSFRHLDAIYAIDRPSGVIAWKLGGSTRPESLTVVGDQVFSGGSHFGGQHDSRILSDGTVTLFDDGTNLGRAPRAVQYSIDTKARTATLLQSVSDPGIAASNCCGSARLVGSGDWVIGWGGNDMSTEEVGNARDLRLTFPGAIVYRTIPIGASRVSVAQLDAAMDVRFDHPSAQAQSSPEFVPYPP
jgi:hypothetical protein